jgi:predicted peroxiredoxin
MTDVADRDLGLVITKAPLESSAVLGILKVARNTLEQGRSVGIFLISDGAWLVKKGQKNDVANLFQELLKEGVDAQVSSDHLDAAGIPADDIVEGVRISRDIYKDLVTSVMERWGEVMTI